MLEASFAQMSLDEGALNEKSDDKNSDIEKIFQSDYPSTKVIKFIRIMTFVIIEIDVCHS